MTPSLDSGGHDRDNRVDDRGEGRRTIRRRQRDQPVLRDARERTSADPDPRRARIGRDVRAGDPGARSGAPGHRPRPPGAWADGRHRSADRHQAHGRRHRGPHRPPRARQAGPRRLLARWRGRLLHRGEVPGQDRQARHGVSPRSARRDPGRDAGPAGPGERGRRRVHEGNADVRALPQGRSAARRLPAAARQDRRVNGEGLRLHRGAPRPQGADTDRRGRRRHGAAESLRRDVQGA